MNTNAGDRLLLVADLVRWSHSSKCLYNTNELGLFSWAVPSLDYSVRNFRNTVAL